MKTAHIGKVPRTYRGKVNWYVSPHLTREAIHCFNTKSQAIAFAASMPACVVSGFHMLPSIDWFAAGSNARHQVSSTRQIVDHRK